MRKLFVLFIVLAMFMTLPLAAANAQDERFEADIHTEIYPVGIAPDGGEIWEGGFYVLIGGDVVETGVVRYTVYGDAAAAHYRGKYRDASTGNLVHTTGKVFLTGFDETTGVATYAVTEEIVSSTDGVAGHAEGVIYLQVGADGTALFAHGWNHWILN